VYVPVAVNCCVVPNGIDAELGATAIDIRAAGVTNAAVYPVTKS
jgi:hypothetical protein